MPKTAIGLFEKTADIEDVIRKIEALGLPRQEIRTLTEPATFEITDPNSFPRLDFEVDLKRQLTRLGADKTEVEAFVEGLRRGSTLLLATGPEGDGTVDEAAGIMNRYGAVGLEEMSGPEPHLPHVPHPEMLAVTGANPTLAGRIRQSDGACVFVW